MPTSRSTRALGHPGPHTQLCQKLAPSTSDLTPALGHPSPATRLQDLALPAHRPALTPEPDFTHQWVSYSPGVLWTLIMPRSNPEDLWDFTISCLGTQSCQLVPAASTKGRAGQAGGPGAKQAHQTAHMLSPPQQKDSWGLIGGTPRAWDLSDKRGVCCWDAFNIYCKRPFLQGREIRNSQPTW